VQGLKIGGRVSARADPATSEWIRSPELMVQGRVVFVATSERIWSRGHAPSTRVQGLQKGGRKGGSGHERADMVTRAG
jgi:hypothetical protein